MSKPMMPKDANGKPIQALRPSGGENLSFTAASAATGTAVAKSVVRLISTQDCYVAFGANPTAVAGNTMLKAGVPEIFRANANIDKIAAIRVTNDGILNITELG